jgi:hypothetical protein
MARSVIARSDGHMLYSRSADEAQFPIIRILFCMLGSDSICRRLPTPIALSVYGISGQAITEGASV